MLLSLIVSIDAETSPANWKLLAESFFTRLACDKGWVPYFFNKAQGSKIVRVC